MILAPFFSIGGKLFSFFVFFLVLQQLCAQCSRQRPQFVQLLGAVSVRCGVSLSVLMILASFRRARKTACTATCLCFANRSSARLYVSRQHERQMSVGWFFRRCSRACSCRTFQDFVWVHLPGGLSCLVALYVWCSILVSICFCIVFDWCLSDLANRHASFVQPVSTIFIGALLTLIRGSQWVALHRHVHPTGPLCQFWCVTACWSETERLPSGWAVSFSMKIVSDPSRVVKVCLSPDSCLRFVECARGRSETTSRGWPSSSRRLPGVVP